MGKRAREQRRAEARAQTPAAPAPRKAAQKPRRPARDPIALATRGNNRWDALQAVEEAAQLEASVMRRKDRAVIRARSMGASWTDLGKVLGVSPQAVQQKYGKRGVPPGPQP